MDQLGKAAYVSPLYDVWSVELEETTARTMISFNCLFTAICLRLAGAAHSVAERILYEQGSHFVLVGEGG